MSLETLTDLCTPWCVHVAVTLRVAEHIDAGAGRVEDLATVARCDVHALRALMGQLVSKGVFEEPRPGCYALNQASRELMTPGARLGLDLEGVGGRMAHAWATMLTFVRTGRTAYRDVFGGDFWDDLEANPALGRGFDELMGMVGHGAPDPRIELSGGWDSVRTVVDVGGGSGLMLAALLQSRPGLQGILVDLPRTAGRAAETFREYGVSDRARAIGQSFFDPLPPGFDLYLLKKVLSNWPDAEAGMVLRRCAEAARPHGRVVVIGGVGPDGAPVRMAIDILLTGGRERSIAEFRELADRAGLEVIAVGRQAAGRYVVECRPAL